MTTQDPRVTALDRLVHGRDAGGYTLPADVIAAHDTYVRAAALTVPTAERLHHDTAARDLAEQYVTGPGTEPMLTAAQRVHDSAAAIQVAELAAVLHQQAVVKVAARAVDITAEHGSALVTDCLRPAYTDLLEQGRKAAQHLDKITEGTDVHSLLVAPPKARAAYIDMKAHADRHDVLWDARACVLKITGERSELDDHGVFLEVEDPISLQMALQPGWLPGRSALRRPETPKDPVARMVWLCTTATPGKPWMPTTAEMDAAWDRQFGDAVRARGQARRNAEAFGALIAG